MKLFLNALLILLLVACGGKTEKPDLIEQGTMRTSDPVDTCLCDILVEDSLKVSYADNKPFTGVCIHNYPNSDQKYMVKSMLNGKLHGTVTYYDQRGAQLMEVIYENGNKKRSGNNAPINCDCAELETVSKVADNGKRTLLDDIPFTGTCYKEYPDTKQTYTQITYKDGLLDGFTTFYDKQGKIMYIEKYEAGELIKVITN